MAMRLGAAIGATTSRFSTRGVKTISQRDLKPDGSYLYHGTSECLAHVIAENPDNTNVTILFSYAEGWAARRAYSDSRMGGIVVMEYHGDKADIQQDESKFIPVPKRFDPKKASVVGVIEVEGKPNDGYSQYGDSE